jgi:predicted transcriptional regulator
MKQDKAEALRLIECLPDDALVEDALYEIAFVQDILEAEAEADRGELIPHEEVKKRMGRWLKSAGR